MADKEKNEEGIKDFDDILEHVGGWGKYQILLLFTSMPFAAMLPIWQFTPILFMTTPSHECSMPENATNDYFFRPEDADERKCFIIYKNDSMDDSARLPCPFGWDYDTEGAFDTVIKQMDWVCDDAWRGPLTQSIFFVGSMFGLLFFGWLGDNYGRLATFLASNSVVVATGIILPYCADFYTFVVVRFIMGLSLPTFYNSIFVLALEYVSPHRRTVIGSLSCGLGITLGATAIPWVLKAMGDWKLFHQILMLLPAVAFLAPLYVRESASWLISVGQAKKALANLERIAITNGRVPSPDVWKSIEEFALDMERKAAATAAKPRLYHLLKTPWLRRNVILSWISWSFTMVLFDAQNRNQVNLHLDVYTTFTLFSVSELPANLFVLFSMQWLGRKWTIGLGHASVAILFLICAQFAGAPSAALVVLAVTARVFGSVTMAPTIQFMHELHPTVLRAQGGALAAAIAYGSTFCSPYIINTGDLDPSYPFYIVAAASVLATVVTLSLPESAGEVLANTLDEGETFGRKQKLIHIPCLEERKRRKREAEEREEANKVAGSIATLDSVL